MEVHFTVQVVEVTTALLAAFGCFIGIFLLLTASVDGIRTNASTCITQLTAERRAASSGCLN